MWGKENSLRNTVEPLWPGLEIEIGACFLR
eukprot:COSAG02_NODE_92_length_37588_cov_135.916242_17_plen_30_part_00